MDRKSNEYPKPEFAFPVYKPVFHKQLIDEPYSPVGMDGKPRKQ